MVQEASAAFEEAVQRSSVIWDVAVEVDWDQDGYGGARTLDDLTDQTGGIQIAQSMDDGLPDEVSLLNNSGIPTATARLGGRTTRLRMFDTFDRSVLNGWGFSDSGHEWQLVDETGDLTNELAIYTDGSDGVFRIPVVSGSVRTKLANLSVADGVVRATWEVDQLPTAGTMVSHVGMRLSGSGSSLTYYRLIAYIDTDANLSAELEKVLAGVVTDLDTDIDFEPEMKGGTMVSMILWCRGTSIMGKVWRGDASAEPDEWNLSATDSAITTAGAVTAFSQASSGATGPIEFRWSVFQVDAQEGAYSQILNPTQFFSPFQPRSPLYGRPRDVQPARIQVGAVTDDGRERVPVFTGRLADIPLGGGRATLALESQTRRDLSALVYPIVVTAKDSQYTTFNNGLTTTWPVSKTLYDAGVYAAPPPQADGLRMYLPMHGGGAFFEPSVSRQEQGVTFGPMYGWRVEAPTPDNASGTSAVRLPWVRGPFVAGSYGKIDADLALGYQGVVFEVSSVDNRENLQLLSGTDFFSQAGSVGRLTAWVRGDSYDMDTAMNIASGFLYDPGQTGVDNITGWIVLAGPVTPTLHVGINNNRQLFVQLRDGTNTFLLTSSTTLPEDGLWHAVGWAWDAANENAWTYLDGVVTTDSFVGSFNTAALPATSAYPTTGQQFQFWIPTAEVILTSGPAAHPDTGNPWIHDVEFTPRAEVYPCHTALEVVGEIQPTEAWQLLAHYARGELVAMGINESDVFFFRPRGYFATELGQTVQEEVTTDFTAATPDVILDPTRIRTVTRVTYEQVMLEPDPSEVLNYSTSPIFIPGGIGVSFLTLALDHRVWGMESDELDMLTSSDIANASFEPTAAYAAVNSKPNGAGDYATASDVLITLYDWHSQEATLKINNLTGHPWYFAHPGAAADGIGFISLWGYVRRDNQASVTEQYDYAVAQRGVRGLTASLPALQDEVAARRVARRLLADLHRPQIVVTGVEAFGDPRLQAGDLVTLEDERETGVSELIRVHSIRHSIEEGQYTRSITGKQALQVGIWGVSRWGQCLWAGEEAERA